MRDILIAGIGNIFNGDDGFGVAVAQRLAQRAMPEAVQVVDFGIRGIDLTYALLDPYRAVVLVDAAPMGRPPGTISIVEPHIADENSPPPEGLAVSGHALDPATVLSLAATLGGTCRRVLLVACEPLDLGGEDGAMGLSPPVAAAVDTAVAAIDELMPRLIAESATQSAAKAAQI